MLRRFLAVLTIATCANILSAVEVKLDCKQTPEDVAICTITNSSADAAVLLLGDGSLEGPILGQDYVFISIGASRSETVLQYGPIDKPLWTGFMFEPSVCITPERLATAVSVGPDTSAIFTVRVAPREVRRRLRGRAWRLKFFTVAASWNSLTKTVGELGEEWTTALSSIQPVADDYRVTLPSGTAPRSPVCGDDSQTVSGSFTHIHSLPFETHLYADTE